MHLIKQKAMELRGAEQIFCAPALSWTRDSHLPKQDIVYTVYGLLVTVLFPWHLFMLATQPSWEFAARTAILTVGWSFAGPSTPAGTRFV